MHPDASALPLSTAAEAFALSDSGALVLDRGGRVLFHNSAAEELLGLRRGGARDALQAAPHVFLDGEMQTVDPGGRIHRLRVRTAPTDWDGTPAQLVVLNRVGLDEGPSVDDRDRLIALIGHELRNPLSAVSVTLGALGQTPQSDRDAELCALAEAEVDHARRLLENLLESCRDRPRDDLDLAAVDAAALLRRSLTQLREQADLRDVTLDDRLGGDKAPVRGDATRLLQVFSNVVGNAVKFSPGGTVSVACEFVDGLWRLSVRDDGAGMSEETMNLAFDRFYKASGGTEGFGIGLTLARSLVHAHGGALSMKSRVGEGTLVTIDLPAASDVEEPSEPHGPRLARGRAAGGLVMVVEDSPGQREVLRVLLEGEGWRVEACASAEEARERLAACGEAGERPDVLLTDLTLPGDSGLDLVAGLPKAGRPYCVALTGLSSMAAECREVGFNDILEKPVDAKLLREALRASPRPAP